MIKHGRKQKIKTGAEMEFLYCRKLYCYLKNGKAARKLKKQLNKRYRKEMKEEDVDDVQDNWED